MSRMLRSVSASAAVASIIWAWVLFPVWITGTSLATGRGPAAVVVGGGASGAAFERRVAGHRSASGSGAAGLGPALRPSRYAAASGVSVKAGQARSGSGGRGVGASGLRFQVRRGRRAGSRLGS